MKMFKQATRALLLAQWADSSMAGDIASGHRKSQEVLEFTIEMPTDKFAGIDSSKVFFVPVRYFTFRANESDPNFNRTAFVSMMTNMNAVVTESTDHRNQNSRQLYPYVISTAYLDIFNFAPILRNQEYLIGAFDYSSSNLPPDLPIGVVVRASGQNSAAVILLEGTFPLSYFDSTQGFAFYISPTSVIQSFSMQTGCTAACVNVGAPGSANFHTLNQPSLIEIFLSGFDGTFYHRVVFNPTPVQGGGFGDPHIKTWQNDLFDYNGACDLVLVETPGFAAGLGLWVHIRTTIQEYYSYIQAVAVKIGNEILEVESGGGYYINGVKQEQPLLHSIDSDGDANQTIMGFSLRHNVTRKDRHTFEIWTHPYGKVSIHEYKDFLTVMIGNARAENFQDSIGLMGNFLTGERLARDGVTNMMKDDTAAFGQEWQVRPGVDPLLFHSIREPQYPHACLLPTVTKEERIRRRKLRQNLRGAGAKEQDVTEAQAAKACAGWDKDTKASCIEDVLATGDLGMADQGGAF